MNGGFDPALVALSYVIAALASYVALSLTARVRIAVGRQRTYWLWGGACAMGIGIWSMHFVGMLAFQLRIQSSYEISITLLSLLIAIAVSGFALATIDRQSLSLTRLFVSAIAIACGIAGMHYTGMAALQIAPGIQYDLPMVGLSLIVAMLAALGALKIALGLRRFSEERSLGPRTVGALVMAIAICGMHYTGMLAARFDASTICTGTPAALSDISLAGLIALFSFGLLAVAMLIEPSERHRRANDKPWSRIRFKLAASYLMVALLVAGSGIATLATELQGARRLALLEAEVAAKLMSSSFGDAALDDPDRLQLALRRFRKAQADDALVVDPAGQIIATTDKAREGQKIGSRALTFVRQALADGRSYNFNQPVPGTDRQARQIVVPIYRLAGRAESPVIGALIVEYTPIYDSLLNEVRSTGYLMIVIGAGCVLFISALGLHVAARISKPLVELERGAAGLAAGQFEQRVEVRSNDEIGKLAMAFNALADELRITHEKILEHQTDLELRVVERTKEWRKAEEAQRTIAAELRLITDHMPAALCYVDKDLHLRFHNPRFVHKFHLEDQDIDGRLVADIIGSQTFDSISDYIHQALSGKEVSYERRVANQQNQFQAVLTSLVPRYGAKGEVLGYYALSQDITERKRAEESIRGANDELREINQRLQDTQRALLQSEKMASIGQLAAGVAHEINNPIGYVNSNLSTLNRYLADIFGLIDQYDVDVKTIDNPVVIERLAHARKITDIDFIRQDVMELLDETKEGIGRVTKIVRDLKNFSHSGSDEAFDWADLHAGLDTTLGIVWNEIKYRAEVVKEYGALPLVCCRPSQINQVFLNMLVNSAHAIAHRGVIHIRTGRLDDMVWIEIADTGEGIKPEHLSRIFDPFFTTKPVGKGTGLGLALSYGIVETHHGRIDAESQVGVGTTFRIWLPIQQPVLDIDLSGDLMEEIVASEGSVQEISQPEGVSEALSAEDGKAKVPPFDDILAQRSAA